MKTKKKSRTQSRNWGLVVIGSLVIIMNIVIVAVGLFNIPSLGWLSLILVAGGVSSIAMASIAIKKNQPEWLLLDLILPN